MGFLAFTLGDVSVIIVLGGVIVCSHLSFLAAVARLEAKVETVVQLVAAVPELRKNSAPCARAEAERRLDAG